MSIGFTLEVLGDTQIEREFLRFGERAMEARPLFEIMGRDLMKVEQVQFFTEGAHGSGGWEQLAESTKEQKRRKGQQPWIERATEALFKSLTEEHAEGQIFEAFNTYLHFGTDISHAGFQQGGTVRMPARKLIQLTERERREFARQVQRFIVKGETFSVFG